MKSFQKVVLAATIGLGGVLGSVGPASAVTVGCTNGSTPLASGYTVAINGTTVAATEPGRYDKYWVLVCRDSKNRDYNVGAGLYDPNTGGGMGRFTAADLGTEFTVSFLPDAGTTPMIAQGHGTMTGFTIDANDSNRVTLTVKPILTSDIYGNDCSGAGPADCVLAVKNTHGDRASADNIGIGVSVRYSEQTGMSETDFAVLKGMRWSSSAYYFWMWTSCPAQNGGGQAAMTIEVGGPHFRADGTQNFGNITVFIPTEAVIACFGGPPSMVKDSIAITRSENGTTADATTGTASDVGLQYVVTADDSTGLTVEIPQVTFSKPKYAVGTKNGRSLALKTKTYASLLQLALMHKPVGGSVKVVSKSSRTCAAAQSKVYAYRPGTCKASVVTYNKKGKKVASRTVSFRTGA